MKILQIYVLAQADCDAICGINVNYPRGPQMIICDHGAGPCVQVGDINNPLYLEWRNALNAVNPIDNRIIVDLTISDD